VLSKMLELAMKWEIRTDNPARGIERAPEEKRERFLTPAEIARLGEVLATHPEKVSANAVRLLLLTGARRGEVLGATWDQFNVLDGIWIKPAATTKQNKLHRIPLSAPAMQLLVDMKTDADLENARRGRDRLPDLVHLFPGGKEGQPLQEIKRFWTSVCAKAGISGVRIHDLRHTYASILASSGLSLPIIGRLLGHTQAQTTARYSHLFDDPLRAATERAGAIISGAGRVGAEVLPTASDRRR
jgi:integrase